MDNILKTIWNKMIKQRISDESCIICLMPENVVPLISYTGVTNACRCNPYVHKQCAYKWIQQTRSCPICRTKLNTTILINTDKRLLFIFFRFIIVILQFICYLSLLNASYNIYYITNY